MASDIFSATWVSHSSIGDFLKCPRLYYLNNVYKDPTTGNKISIITPPLALGQAVHEVVESLSQIPTDKRFSVPLSNKLELAWKKIAGEKGGFEGANQESEYKNRGLKMLQKVTDHPGPISKLAVKINMDLPHYWLSEADEIILCGKIDWLEYLPDTDSVNIIDFKTGKRRESIDSLQLPIYYLLAKNCQKRTINSASYWYLQLDDELTTTSLPNASDVSTSILETAKKIKLARKINRMKCSQGGCHHCTPFEKILKGEGKFVGKNDYRQDVYTLSVKHEDSTIL